MSDAYFSVPTSLIGTDCYKDLRDAERRGDYEKWWRFARCLEDAIDSLAWAHIATYGSSAPRAGRKVFTGLGNVMLSGAQLANDNAMNVPTFTSTSTNHAVAEHVSRSPRTVRQLTTTEYFMDISLVLSSWAIGKCTFALLSRDASSPSSRSRWTDHT